MTDIKRVFTVDGKPFYPLGGQSYFFSTYNDSDPEYIFKAVKVVHGNTLSIHVYWEGVEPEEGKFDFTVVDNLLSSARRYELNLILVWFATWMCGTVDYAPDWVKTNPQRFKRVISPSGKALWTLSPHCQANFEADKKAFVAFCNHLKVKDNTKHTVIGLQVENESGILGSDRDYSPEAQAIFDSPVPAKLVDAMKAAGAGRVYDIWQQAGGKKSGTWSDLFGWSAGEFMSAWSIATYHDGLAEAGKAVYNIPMYINVWLGEDPGPSSRWGLPGESYPSGGAIRKVLDIYKWFTPHIDLIAPDFYNFASPKFEDLCASYARDDNPLFIPESSTRPSPALFRAIADYNLIGFFIWDIQHIVAEDGSVRPGYEVGADIIQCVASAIPLLLKYQGTGKIHAVIQEGAVQLLDMDGYLGSILFGDTIPGDIEQGWRRHKKRQPGLSQEPTAPNRGWGLVIQANKNEFYLFGANYGLQLRPKLAPDKMRDATFISDFWQYALNHPQRVDEGHFDQNGEFVVDRRRHNVDTTMGADSSRVVRMIMCD